MKQIIQFVLCCYCLFFAGCQEEKTIEPILEIAKETVLFTQEGNTKEIAVNANQPWKPVVENTASTWCTAEVKNEALRVTVSANPNTETRTAQIELQSGNLSTTIQVKQMGTAPTIELASTRIDLKHDETTYTLDIVSNVKYEVIIDKSVDWLEKEPMLDTRALMEESQCKFKIQKNGGKEKRFTEVIFKQTDGDVSTSLILTQSSRDTEYKPGDSEGIGDRKIKVTRGEANQWQDKENIELSFDNDASTHYHSPYYSTKLPVELIYYFEQPELLDYIVYTPRTRNGTNGRWGTFALEIARNNSNTFEKIGDYDFKFTGDYERLVFDKQETGVTAVRFTVTSGANNLVSCAEMEFYQRMEFDDNLESIFADNIYSELHPGITQKQIDEIKNSFFRNIAQSLFDKTYNLHYRVQEYEPYRPTDDLSRELKTSGYCPFENATGIWFKNEEKVIVFVGDTYGEKLSLNIYDFDAKRRGETTSSLTTYSLVPGINNIKIKGGGLAYINYYTKNWETAQKINIHIASGEVNGYFDLSKNQPSEWNTILGNTTYGCIDLKGKRINIVYGVNSLRTYCKNGTKLMEEYDWFVEREQQIMGLPKYNRVPDNHMFIRVVHNSEGVSGMFADWMGVGLKEGIMDKLADETRLGTEGIWSVAHELGHVNQVRPNLRWTGTGEVTNNIYSICLRYERTPNNLNLEHENCNDGDGNNVLGGRFNSFLNYGIVKGEQWMFQKGQDNTQDYAAAGGDHFVKLCPLWQLLLYYRYIKGQTEWYGDVAERARLKSMSDIPGDCQVEFMKNVCDVLKVDLTDFFIKIGMLRECNRKIENNTITISKAQYDNVINHAKQYSRPDTPVLYYLTVNSADAYKNKLSVSGSYNQGITQSNGTCTISHSIWKNVTVFETYTDTELAKVAMVGTNSKDRSTTLVRYPEGSTAIYAVAWDGKRTLVYGQSNGMENK